MLSQNAFGLVAVAWTHLKAVGLEIAFDGFGEGDRGRRALAQGKVRMQLARG